MPVQCSCTFRLPGLLRIHYIYTSKSTECTITPPQKCNHMHTSQDMTAGMVNIAKKIHYFCLGKASNFKHMQTEASY